MSARATNPQRECAQFFRCRVAGNRFGHHGVSDNRNESFPSHGKRAGRCEAFTRLFPFQSIKPAASSRMRCSTRDLATYTAPTLIPSLGGHLGSCGIVQSQPAKGAERDGLELLLNQVEQASEDVAVVFLVPLAIERAIRVNDPAQDFAHAAATGEWRPGVTRPPVVAQTVSGDGAEPRAEGTGMARMLERREGFHDGDQDLLGKVVAVVLGEILLSQPVDEEGAVQIGEVFPRRLVA